MAEVVLDAELRDGRGKGIARRLRAAGKVPATLYGRGTEPMALTVDARKLLATLSTDAGANVLIDLQVAGDTHLTLAREVSRDPIRGSYIHVDFLKIAHDQKIAVGVPINIEGDSPGVKEGGVLEHHLWQIQLECLPGNVPERVSVDVSQLGIGESLHVGDITPPEGTEILSPADELIVACVVPQAMKVEADVPEAAAGEAATAAGEAAPAGDAGGS
ncbi:MAG TPA: 50S ribosomal protein L25 [Actinomycetota bacterium]|nr:50S ribosomal protein L25 [Actinomycetota bacterium]